MPLPSSRALLKLFPHLSVHADAYPMLGFFAAKGAKTKHRRTERRAKWKPLQPPAKNFFPCMSLCSAFRHRLRSLWHQFFGTIALMEFVLKNPCQQRCSFTLAPCQRSYACPMAQGLETLADLGRTVFRNNRIDEICPEKPVPTALDSHHIAPSQRSSPRAISHGFPPSTLSSLPCRSPRGKVN